MWFWFSVIALIFWSGSDLFSKIGCQDKSDPYSHLKMVMAVGLVMGIHAFIEIFFAHVDISWHVLLKYLPVSLLYISSMAIGYLGLTLAVDGLGSIVAMQLLAVGFVIVGIIGLGITEATEDEELRKARQEACNHRYTKSVIAILIPIIYCLLDALGTFADSRVLLTLNEDSANTAYELTFLIVGICCAIYTLGIKKQKLVFKQEVPKYAGALCETAGQYAYIYALADEAHVALAAPIISAYCVLSVVWSRLILKEKLSFKHYAAIVIVVIGIVILGLYDA